MFKKLLSKIRKTPVYGDSTESDSKKIDGLYRQVQQLTAQVNALTTALAAGDLIVRKVRRVKVKTKAAPAVAPKDDAKPAPVAADKTAHNEVLGRMKKFVEENKNRGNSSGRGEVYHLVNGKRETIHLTSLKDIEAVISRAEKGELQLVAG